LSLDETDDIEPATEDAGALVDRYGRAFSAGEALFHEGDPSREAFLLYEGRVRLLKRVRVLERSLAVLHTGDIFGEGALLSEAPRSSTALALTDGIALVFDRASFRALVEHRPAIGLRILNQFIKRVREAEDQIEVLMLKDTQSKIVSALLKLAGAAPGAVELSISPVDLSVRVGLDVDTVKRAVQRLREQGYVRIVGERVTLPEPDALRRLYALLASKEELRGNGVRS
jgi:CRP-like cAMP-binding protein